MTTRLFLEIGVVLCIAVAIAVYVYYLKRRVHPKSPQQSNKFFKQGENPKPNMTVTESKPSSFFRNVVPRRVGNKIQLPLLHSVKRISAVLVFLVHLVFFITAVLYPTPNSGWYALALLVNEVILIDYLWKTRSSE